jgi:hypothetical protein
MPLNQAGQQVPFPPVPNVIKLSMKFTTATDLDIVTNTHWKYTGGPPVASDLQAFLSNVATESTNQMEALVPTTVTHVQDTATDLASAQGVQQIQTHAQVGTRTGAYLPINAACLINMKIQRRYRGGKPRNYWPFGVQGDLVDDAHWSSTAITAFTTGFSNWANGLLVAQGAITLTNLVNVSYYQGHFAVQNGVTKRYRNVPTLGPTPPYPYVDNALSLVVNPTLGSQRRRLRPG